MSLSIKLHSLRFGIMSVMLYAGLLSIALMLCLLFESAVSGLFLALFVRCHVRNAHMLAHRQKPCAENLLRSKRYR